MGGVVVDGVVLNGVVLDGVVLDGMVLDGLAADGGGAGNLVRPGHACCQTQGHVTYATQVCKFEKRGGHRQTDSR